MWLEDILLFAILAYIAYDDAFKNVGTIRVSVILPALIILCIVSFIFHTPSFSFLDVVGLFLILYDLILVFILLDTPVFYKTYTLIVTILLTLISLAHNTTIYYAIFYSISLYGALFGDVGERAQIKKWSFTLTLLPTELLVTLLFVKGYLSFIMFLLIQACISYTLLFGGFIGGGDLILFHLLTTYYPLIGYASYIISPIVGSVVNTLFPNVLPKVVIKDGVEKAVKGDVKEILEKEEIENLTKTSKEMSYAAILLFVVGACYYYPALIIGLPLLGLWFNISPLWKTLFKKAIYTVIAYLLSLALALYVHTSITNPLLLALYTFVVISIVENVGYGLFIGAIAGIYALLESTHILPTPNFTLTSFITYPFLTLLFIDGLKILVIKKVELKQMKTIIAVPYAISIFISSIILYCLTILNRGLQ